MPRFGAIVFDLLTALLDSSTLWSRVAGDEPSGEPLAVIETLTPLPALVR